MSRMLVEKLVTKMPYGAAIDGKALHWEGMEWRPSGKFSCIAPTRSGFPTVSLAANTVAQLNIMTMKIILPFIAIFLAGCASQNTYMGHKVVDAPFTIAGGKTVSLPVTDAGPIPAENQSFKIEVAGFAVGPSKDNPNQAMLIWQFALTSKSSQSMERVIVEEVAPTEVAKLLVEDHAPTLKEKIWLGTSQPVEASKTATPWLYTDKASIYVFRFTIKARGEPDTVLYQAAWFSKPAKEKFREMIAKINGSY